MIKHFVAFIIVLSLLPLVATATCTKQSVKAAEQRWAAAIASNNPEVVTKLYANESLLFATLKGKPFFTKQERYRYFQHLFHQFDKLHVRYDTNYIHVYRDVAISVGYYTFIGIKKGKEEETRARYTFIYESTPKGCELIYHHSSLKPENG